MGGLYSGGLIFRGLRYMDFLLSFLNIQPCPSPCSDLYLIGVHPFSGVYFILAAGKRILMLSNAIIKPSSKHHRLVLPSERTITYVRNSTLRLFI